MGEGDDEEGNSRSSDRSSNDGNGISRSSGSGSSSSSTSSGSSHSGSSSASASWLGGLFGTSQKFDLKDYGLGSWLGGSTKSGDESRDSGDESGESATDTKGSKHNANHHDHADAKSPDAEKSKTSSNTQKQKTSEAKNSDPKSGAGSDSKSASSPLSTSKLSDASWGVLNFSSEGKEEKGKEETSAEENKDQKKRPEKVKSAEKQKSDEIEMLNSMAMSVVEDDEVGMKKVETKEKELKKDKQKIEKAAGHGDEGFLGVFGLSDLGRSIGKGGLVVREEGKREKGKHDAVSREEENGEKSGSGSKTIPSGERTIHGEHSSHPDGKNVKKKSDESKGLLGDLLGTIGLSDTVNTLEKGRNAVDAASALPHDTPHHPHKPAEKHSAAAEGPDTSPQTEEPHNEAAAHEDPHNDTSSTEKTQDHPNFTHHGNVKKKNPPSTWWRTVTGDFANGSLDEKFTEYTDEKIARKSMDQLNNVAQSHTPLDKEAIENGEADEFVDDAEIERPKQLIEEAKEAAQRKEAMMKGTGKNSRKNKNRIHHHHDQQRSGAGSGGGKKGSWFGNMFDQEVHGVGKDLEKPSTHDSPAKDDSDHDDRHHDHAPNVAKRKETHSNKKVETHSNNKKTSSAENLKKESGSSWMSHPLSIIGFSEENNQAAFETSSSLKAKDEKIDEALFGEHSSDNVNMSNFNGETEEKLVIKIPAVDLTPISDGFFKFISKDQYESIYHSYCFYGGEDLNFLTHYSAN
jgi:hypothetical protein